MLQSNRIVWALLALVMIAVGIWVFTDRAGDPAGQNGPTRGNGKQDSSTTLSDSASLEDPLAQQAPGKERGLVPIKIRIMDALSLPIVGALASWTPARTDWIAHTVSESDRPWTEIEAGSKFAHSSSDGTIELTFDAREHAAVWVSHQGHVARVFHNLSGGELKLPDTIVLDGSSAMVARVVLEDSSPVAGALVRQCASLWDKPLDGVNSDVVAVRLFQRSYTSGADGTISLAGLRGYHCLTASIDNLVSNLWTGVQPCEPLLTLRSTFTASGTVPPHPDPTARKTLDRVFVTADVDTGGEEIGYLTAREDGSWGPIQLPCRPASEYRFTLESDVWLAQLVRRPAPRPGEVVRIDFPGVKGLTLRVQTVQNNGEPIEGVRVGMTTMFDDTRLTTQAYTNKDGGAVFRTFKPGALWVSTHKDGYEPTHTDRFEIFVEPNVPYRVELTPGSAIRGRVVRDGKPVRTFAVRLWNDEKLYSDDRHFQDRPDGTFEINDVPVGEVSVIGSSLPSFRSEPLHLVTEPGKSADVEIDLSNAIVGTGRVIAASSGLPIAEASVQPQLHVPGHNFGAFGPAHGCGVDGSFRIAGFGPGVNVGIISAPGFATKRVTGTCDTQGLLDFGWIALQRPGRLDVSLSVDKSEPIEEFAMELMPDDLALQKRFDSEGKLSFKEHSPGIYEADIHMKRFRRIQSYIDVAAGVPTSWIVEHRPVRDLIVEVVPAPGSEPPKAYACNVGYVSPAGREEWYFARLDDQLRCDLSCIPSDTMVVDVVSDEMAAVATRRVKSSRTTPQVVRIPLDGESRRIRLTSKDGRPIFPAWVQFNQAADGVNWSTARQPDENGELSLNSLPPGPISAIVSSDSFRKWIKELPIPAKRDEVISIVIANDSFADLLALDGTSPLPGLMLHLSDPIGQDSRFDMKDTSPDGHVRFDFLEQQEFEVKVTEPGYWPTQARFTPTPTGTQVDVQVRRLGGTRIRASIVGTPYRRKPIALHSLEFDTDVSMWIASGRVQASSSKLETDDDGRLTVDGLPNGPYRWTAKNSSGEIVTGEFTVPPRSTADVNVALP